MSFLAVNSIVIPCSVERGAESIVEIGEMGRAFDGTLIGTRRAKKKEWGLRTTLLSQSEAEAVKSLILGEGHYWTFDDDLYSSKGLGPQSGSTSATQSTSGGKYGGKAAVTSLAYETELTGDYTVNLWRKSSSGTYQYWTVRSDGKKWRDATNNDALGSTWLSVDSDGDLNITGSSTGGARDCDELMALPYLATTSQVDALHSWTTQFSELPRLDCYGDLVNRSSSETMQCMGRVEQAEFVQVQDAQKQRITFTLLEV